jgi:hypothetical protein
VPGRNSDIHDRASRLQVVTSNIACWPARS